MRYFVVALIFVFVSCSEQSELDKKYQCDILVIDNVHTITDFNKNFKLTIPKRWKTQLYFSKYESQIFTADTIKQLTKSFILSTSFNTGVLKFNQEFYDKTATNLAANNLHIINSGNELFQSNQAYWFVAQGVKNGYTYHQFNLTIKQPENTYFTAYSEIYGDSKIHERICETIAILEKVKFLQ